MKILHCEQMASAPYNAEGVENCRTQCLIGPDDAAPSFSMRYFVLGPGGHTPKHTHAHEHEVFVLEGQGVVLGGTEEHPLRPGCAVFVAPNELHQFRNTGQGEFKFLCIIPHPLRGMRGVCTTACSCNG